MNPGWLLCLAVVLLSGCAAPIRAPVAERSDVAGGHAGSYVVARGDSLYSIAFRHALDYRELAAWNGIRAPFTIFPGQTLRLSAPSRASMAAASDSARTQAAPRREERTANKPIARPTTASRNTSWRWPVDVQPTERFDNESSGLDYELPVGATIRAASPGEVVFVGPGMGNFLHLVIVKVDERYLAAYAVNVPPVVSEGDGVAAGSAIARVGRGRTSLRHFHFEIRERGKPVDPHRLIE